MSSKILIVDDEESLRFTFESFLTNEGYEVRTAETLEGAREVMELFPPDLVFSDIILGSASGVELLSEIKSKELPVPVIMITGKPNIDSAAESVRLGAYDYLPKPVKKETLLRVASKALEFKALHDERDRLSKEKERYSNLLDAILFSVKDAIIAVDREMNVIQANQALSPLCGIRPEESQGLPFDQIPTGCVRSCFTLLSQVLEHGDPLEEQRVECRHPGGHQKVIGAVASPLKDKNGRLLGGVLVLRDLTRLEKLEQAVRRQHEFQGIIGQSGIMQKMFRLMESVSDTETTVLITGQSGTGKELVAKALHDLSSRSRKPLTTVNCAALSESLLESELFGHIKGAFTGAVKDRVGWFQAANGGTIFLDEVGELSHAMQKKLLRVLQEKTFERVGDTKTIKTDVRVIAATNKDLKRLTQTGEFREDLYYRLKVVELNLPPLRDRREDIPLLVAHFCERFNGTFKKSVTGVTDEVMKRFMEYDWPGNVRELEHVVEHAFVLCSGRSISISHLPEELSQHDPAADSGDRAVQGQLSAEAIQETLKQTDGNKAKAARILGVSRQTLYRHLQRLSLDQ